MKRRIPLLIICVFLCFGLAFAAFAESPLTAKQMMLMKLKDTNFGVSPDFYKHSSGKATYEMKTLGGSLVPKEAPFTSLPGTKLDLDYKFSTPARLLEANYSINYNKENYSGSLYLTGDKVILTTEVMALLQAMDPDAFDGGPLPQYVYIADKEITRAWDSIIKSNGQSLPPEFKDLLIFVVEAVPEKYFSTSLSSGKVVFSIDKDGFADVVFAVLQKVKNEKDRFAALAANAVVSMNPEESAAKVKAEILKSIDKSIADGSYPDSRDELAYVLGGALILEEFSIESSLAAPGQSRGSLVLAFGPMTGVDGKITFKADGAGDKDNFSGAYVLSVNAKEKKQGITVNGKVDGKYSQKAGEMLSSGQITLNVSNPAGSLIYFALTADSSARVDDEVEIKVPVLTRFNSKNLEDLANKTAARSPGLKVVLNGKPMAFDVSPFIQDGRTMVPIRNLAEELGFTVDWTPPNQIKMSRNGKVITMYLNQNYYTANGVKKKLDVPPYVKDGRTIVPIRFVAEEFGCMVSFDDKTKTVYINSN